MSFIDKPQTVWIRRALFQIHLWLGVLLSLYFLVIGVSGSILVFREDIDRWMQPALPPMAPADATDAAPPATVGRLVDAVHARYPDRRIFSLRTPHASNPAAVVFIEAPDNRRAAVWLDPQTTAIVAETVLTDTWLSWVARLHISLLSGRPGLVANGIGAIGLLVLCLSGVVIWWPGIKAWTRALKIDLSKSWKRINFDLHSAVGFWLLAWVAMWSVTTIYFVWPDAVSAAVRSLSPLTEHVKIVVPPRTKGTAPSLDAIIAHAQELYPADKLAGVILPGGEKDALMLQMARGRIGDFTHTDFVYFDPSTGKHLGTFSRGANETIGDWIMWLMYPLHFGSDWGLTMKIIWGLAGLSLPLLSITGLLMYWNRYLSKKWRQVTLTRGAAQQSVVRP